MAETNNLSMTVETANNLVMKPIDQLQDTENLGMAATTTNNLAMSANNDQ